MRKPSQLKKLDLEVGDCSRIQEIFNERNKEKGQKVSLSYVYLITIGKRPATPGTIAQDVQEIAQKYLESKKQIKRELIAA
jgi:hypothetical protein